MNQSCKQLMGSLCKLSRQFTAIMLPIHILALRILLGYIFFNSGLLKAADMGSAIFIFELDFALPILPPYIWAYATMLLEITAGFCLIVGFMTRLAALPILAMTLVIQFILGLQNPVFYQYEHYFWMLGALYMVCYGGGRISIDTVLWRIFGDKYCHNTD